MVAGQAGQAQYAKRTMSKGPRALGLVELAPNGKAHLIPITILSEGKFYDAGAYKAAPVPMALEPRTVYEAFRSGVSQGLFTVTDVRQLKTAWVADGTWLPAGAAPPKTGHSAEAKPIMGDSEAPPKLRRGAEKPVPASSPDETKPQAPAQTSPSPPAAAPASNPSPSATTAAPPENAPSPPQEQDKDAPVLRRGKPTDKRQQVEADTAPPASPRKKTPGGKSAGAAPGTATATATAVPPVQLIPAISDAGGPEARPYTYEPKPEEEQKYRQKILALAAEQIRTRSRQLGTGGESSPSGSSSSSPSASSSARRRTAAATKGPQPSFDDVQLRFFDLSTSNEPVLVLTATAHMARAAGGAPANADELQYFIAVVARADIYGDLRKLFSNVTDTRHLDAIPRMELVDAVDVDGDGRGELLFRQISDAGSAFNVYRVTGDQLWPLFEGAPQ